MLDAIQRFFQMDDATFRFAGVYIATGLILAAMSCALTLSRPQRAPRSDEPDRRPPAVRTAVNAGKSFVALVARLPVTPNQITVIGLVLVAFNCGLFAISGSTFWFGTGLIAALLFDTLDGLVARAQGTSSRFGGYLDAVIDRYQEIAIYLTVGWVVDQWLPTFLIVTGSLLTSYNKARVALEIETSNKGWPDLLEKPLRMFILCVGLIGAPIMPWFLPFALWMLAAMTHFTAIQRFARAAFMLTESDSAERAATERT
jgi:phosphatidylglycerophosphate synthase